jgi:hypothetical protein
MVGAPHDFPRVAMIIHVTPPGERFIADAQPSPGGPLTQLTQIGSCPLDTAQRNRRNRGADQNEIRSQLLHDIKLALGAVECAAALRLRQAFEVAERLIERNGKAGVGRHLRHITGRTIEGQEIVLEYFDAVKPGCSDRRQLFWQVTADGNGSDRGLHEPS